MAGLPPHVAGPVAVAVTVAVAFGWHWATAARAHRDWLGAKAGLERAARARWEALGAFGGVVVVVVLLVASWLNGR